MDGKHPGPEVQKWLGDSIGWWEGDTLVVETTNFRSDFGGASTDPERFRLVERLTRVSADTLSYEYTMNDPQTWTRPWTVRIPMSRSAEHVFEYACHEGNYGLPNILRGARVTERGGTP
jgi:hypothetical protein